MTRAFLLVLMAATLPGQESGARSTYVLGPGDQIVVRVLDLEEIGKDPYQIDIRGNVNLPMAGRVRASGRTLEEFEAAIGERLMPYLKKPEVTVSVLEMRSQPVSVLGSVKNPGVFQVQGQKTLLEMVSLAGGLNPDAGYAIRIARQKAWGEIPVEGARFDESGQFYVAEVGVRDIMEARSPAQNIQVKPNDVITVPKGQVVYVMGAVKKSGGFVLGEREKTTVLQALSMAEGVDNYANNREAKILRRTANPEIRAEITVNLAEILKGTNKDVPMQSDDILYVPVSGSKKAMARTLDAMISMGTGVVIYGRR
ncbi:polysaccharide biosynthesis/export family protein [Paludibaculum fermentans]|uniref:Polysaccharide biosynthesis/export family protein n=1 Tax=Paludibaculum fermentans TaxID=1473598 RepID=A0A7S7NMA6_PALFE|nr:polysaccharide biosynthesis/export family protein [Paludibaculum fermentans]QOY86261.1 polysaccharide biosynthesis/export family protein [Paludibaculum fermentans]